MIPGAPNLTDGLSIRPELAGDAAFMARLYKDRRRDLRLIDGDPDFVETLIDSQHAAQTQGYGRQFPNAMHFIVEKTGEAIGRVCLDFGAGEVRLVDIAFLAEARGKGYGGTVVKALQQAATQVRAPLALSVAADDPVAQRLYASLGFQVEKAGPVHHGMIWYPPALEHDPLGSNRSER